ncbi:hypothetical protein G7046_g4302 [Stylonectria norvegica]|nr:hypothetical protein G7046_g4302 [Stylonectria norvegica]
MPPKYNHDNRNNRKRWYRRKQHNQRNLQPSTVPLVGQFSRRFSGENLNHQRQRQQHHQRQSRRSIQVSDSLMVGHDRDAEGCFRPRELTLSFNSNGLQPNEETSGQMTYSLPQDSEDTFSSQDYSPEPGQQYPCRDVQHVCSVVHHAYSQLKECAVDLGVVKESDDAMDWQPEPTKTVYLVQVANEACCYSQGSVRQPAAESY